MKCCGDGRITSFPSPETDVNPSVAVKGVATPKATRRVLMHGIDEYSMMIYFRNEVGFGEQWGRCERIGWL